MLGGVVFINLRYLRNMVVCMCFRFALICFCFVYGVENKVDVCGVVCVADCCLFL